MFKIVQPFKGNSKFSLCKECNEQKDAYHRIYEGFEEHSKEVYGNPHRLISSALGFRYKMNDEFLPAYCKGHLDYEINTLHVHLTNNTASESRNLLPFNVLRSRENLSDAKACFDRLNIDVNPIIRKKFEE